MAKFARPTEEQIALLKRTGDRDKSVALAAQREFAQALQINIRQNLLEGDDTTQIFTPIQVQPGAIANFPLEVLAPAAQKDFIGYTIPGHGRIPERMFESDTVQIGTYKVGSSIDWLLDFARDARFDVVGTCVAILEASFVRKNNLDAWYTLLATAASRGLVVYDSAAPVGYFSKRLMTLLMLAMRRQGGVTTTTLNPIRLTDLFVSPEGLEGMRNWDLTIVDDVTRREIFTSTQTGGLTTLFGVRLHELLELGVGQAYQLFLESFGATLGTNDSGGADTQFVVGLDLSAPNVFVNPIREEVQVWEDETLHRQQRAGYYGWGEHGYGVLNRDRTILGSF